MTTNTVTFKSCNLTKTKTNRVINTASFNYVGEGSSTGCVIQLTADIVAENNGYPDIKAGDLVYKKGAKIFIYHNMPLEGGTVLNNLKK